MDLMWLQDSFSISFLVALGDLFNLIGRTLLAYSTTGLTCALAANAAAARRAHASCALTAVHLQPPALVTVCDYPCRAPRATTAARLP